MQGGDGREDSTPVRADPQNHGHAGRPCLVVRRDSRQVGRSLTDAGAILLDTQPPEESAEFEWGGTGFSTAWFDARPDGTFTPQGRFDDRVFPAGSFPDEPVDLQGAPVLAMSVAGMLAMKEQFPRLRNGRPWRAKEAADVEVLRSLAGA